MTTWLEIGLSNALLAAGLAVVAWVATRLYRHPKVAFVVWLLVLVRLLMPPVVGVAWQGWPADALAEATIDLAPHDPAPPDAALSTALPEVDAADAPRAARKSTPPVPHSWRWPAWRTVVCTAWLAGSALWLAIAVVRIARFRQTLARAPAAGPELQAEVAELARQMHVRRVPVVRLVGSSVPPLVWALARRPTMLLPAALVERLTASQRRTLLAHELAHLKRRDHLVRLLELAAIALFWWHPVAWWARRRVERAGEECCDMAVVSRLPHLAGDYAAALLATVEFLSDAPSLLPVGSSGFSHVRHLKRRLEMILARPVTRRVHWLSRVALCGLALVALAPSVHTVSAQPKSVDKFVPRAGTIEQRLDRLEKAMQALTAELRAVLEHQKENDQPMVVKTEPADGAADVDPNLAEIKVTFNKDMHDGTWSWTQRSAETFPEVTDKPHYIDKRTCVLPVKLAPGKTYHISINSERFQNFKDEGRRPAIPYPLNFTTAK